MCGTSVYVPEIILLVCETVFLTSRSWLKSTSPWHTSTSGLFASLSRSLTTSGELLIAATKKSSHLKDLKALCDRRSSSLWPCLLVGSGCAARPTVSCKKPLTERPTQYLSLRLKWVMSGDDTVTLSTATTKLAPLPAKFATLLLFASTKSSGSISRTGSHESKMDEFWSMYDRI